MKWNSCHKWIWETPDLALLELRERLKTMQIKMQIFPKTKGFHNKRGLFREKLTLFNKNYICILRKNFNPGHWVLDKKNDDWKK